MVAPPWRQSQLLGPSLQTGQFPLTQRVSPQWPRFNQLRDGQKLPKNRLWRICTNTNCENQNDWLDYWSGRRINLKKKRFKKLKLPGRLLVRPWPDQPDRLLRPCNMKVSEQCRIAASKGNQILGMIWRNITYKE